MNIILDHVLVSYSNNLPGAECMSKTRAEDLEKQKLLRILPSHKIRKIILQNQQFELIFEDKSQDRPSHPIEKTFPLFLCPDCEKEVLWSKLQSLEDRLNRLEWNKVDQVISDLERHREDHS